MLGITKELEGELAKRGYTETDLLRLFGKQAHKGSLNIVYQRPNGDRTSGLPSSNHCYYVGQKGWTAVAIVDDPPPAPRREPATPSEKIAALAKGDVQALYRKGAQEAVFSTRHHENLSGKGFEFVREISPREDYLLKVGSKTLSPEEQAIADRLLHVGTDAPKAATK
jgi:hypothetical protein